MVLAAMSAGMTCRQLTHVVAIHPTVSELIPTIAGELDAPRASAG
jgi:pyruvate/2-oxoglutarate dehydrogenase complex dihydrolipoamide dehydrogenase (E3) component